MSSSINIIDLFAGPGGLGEGFSSFQKDKNNPFKIRMSVEKEASAHTTLTLRAFFRLLRAQGDLEAYMDYVEGRVSKEEMKSQYEELWSEAEQETLGGPTALGEDNEKIHDRLYQLKDKHNGEPWIVIGGPPCQAYSLVGRARNQGIEGYSAEDDHRHFLYREYLHVLSIMQPDVFVMENVKGILSSKVGDKYIFPTIKEDLHNPTKAIEGLSHGRSYKIYSFVCPPDEQGLFGDKYSNDQSYIIRAEDFGIPQARHRVILLGVADDLDSEPSYLEKTKQVNVENLLRGLPNLRSKLSKGGDTPEKWEKAIQSQFLRMKPELRAMKRMDLLQVMDKMVDGLKSKAPTKSNRYDGEGIGTKTPDLLKNWLTKDRPTTVLNHESRGHIEGDLGRYFFSACWAEHYRHFEGAKPFPKSEDYPDILAPNHANWKSGKFADRFRVQRKGRPATTVTSHISKDGHYFIHPDPKQCRSLTVREAARIQTFPDNYFFEGNRTQQYVQVGNAVPPFLAMNLAKIVHSVID